MPTSPPPATRGLAARLWRGYLAPHRAMIALAFAAMLLEGSTLAGLSFLIQPLFDRVLVPGGGGSAVLVGGAILALFTLRALSMISARTLVAHVSQAASAAMQVDLLRHILTLDTRFFQTHPPGALIERVQGDTLAVNGVWSTILTGIGRDLFSLLGLFALAFAIDPGWTLAALIGAPVLILPAVLLQRYIRRKAMLLRAESGLRATRLDEVFHGIQSIKLNRIEAYQTGRFAQILARIRRAEVRATASRAMMPGTVDIVTGLGFFAVLMLAADEIASGGRTAGEFMSFFTAMSLTFQPLRRLSELSGLWQAAAASLERVYALFDVAPATTRPSQSARLPAPGAPEIRLEDLHFAHAGTEVLRGMTFTARAGQTTALVGASGAGKSTVFHLLTALQEPDRGRILIGGVDSTDLALADQRMLFAVVTQDSALFDETLLENLTLGRKVAPEALAEALAVAQIAPFLAHLPDGLQSPAGPRGSSLSGGQRQRIAIARALLSPAPVLLLDEATSALDAGAEAAFAAALAEAARGRTTLVIAHRLATIRNADWIVVLDHGKVAEEGTHADLLAAGGLYARLHQLQSAP